MVQKSIEEFQIFQAATTAREFSYLRGNNGSQSVLIISRRFKDDLTSSVIAVFYFSRYTQSKDQGTPKSQDNRDKRFATQILCSCSVRFLNQITFLFLNSGPAGERGEIVLPGKITFGEKKVKESLFQLNLAMVSSPDQYWTTGEKLATPKVYST